MGFGSYHQSNVVVYFKKFGLPDPTPIIIYLSLVDWTFIYLKGIVENVLVKVDIFIFPGNFIILDFEEDKDIHIIAERPFLATGRTLIDVQKGELTMRVEDKSFVFKVFK